MLMSMDLNVYETEARGSRLCKMELDLNQEPFDSPHSSVDEFDSIFDEVESDSHAYIEERIRHIEAVTARARQRQLWPPVHTPIQITNFTGEAQGEAQSERRGELHEVVEEKIIEIGKEGRSKGTYLVAKALGVEETDGSNFYDCNICLNKARDPVLTCCGHLFCWPCFYQLPYAYANAKECPDCKGEVNETDLIPIYVNGNEDSQLELKEAGLRVPPRPKAARIEGIRQQLINQGTPSAVVQNILSPNTAATDRNNVSQILSHPQTGNNRRRTGSRQILRLREQISRFTEQSAAFTSFSSALNTAMNSADRLVEEFESYIHSPHIVGSMQLNHGTVNRNSTPRVTATNFALDVAATRSAAAAYMYTLDPSTSYDRRRRRRRNVSRQDSGGPIRRRLR